MSLLEIIYRNLLLLLISLYNGIDAILGYIRSLILYGYVLFIVITRCL